MAANQVNWVENWMEGLVMAERDEKIAILFIAKQNCSLCGSIFKEIEKSKIVKSLAGEFVIIKAHEEELGENYASCGTYTPRILFLGPDGTILERYCNTMSELQGVKFYYRSAKQFENTMKQAYTDIVDNRHLTDDVRAKNGIKSIGLATFVHAFMAVVPVFVHTVINIVRIENA